jgi:two-component sensor histidine kinase
LTTELLRTHSLGQDVVVIAMNAEPVPISIDQAVPLGLAVNELLSNAMKYAFTDGRRGRIEIEVARNLTEAFGS